MTNPSKKSALAVALAATALTGSGPAMADGYHGSYYHGSGGAGTAVAAGIFGLAIGAIIASSVHHDHHDEPAWSRGGYYPAPYVRQDWAWHDGYYWDGDGNRYGRDGRFYGCAGRRDDHRWHDDRGYRRHDERGYYPDQRGYEASRGY